MSQGPPPAAMPSRPPPPPSSRLPVIAGAVIGAVAPWSLSLVPLILTGGSSVAGYALYAWLLVPLVGVGLLVAPATRRWGAGVLIGFFGMLVVGAGACIVLVLGLNTTGVGG